MKTLSIAVIVAVVLFLAAHSPVAAKEPAITGKWKVISTTWYGKEAPDDVGVIWEFQADNRFVIRFTTGRSLEGRYQIDTDEQPWRVKIATAEDHPDIGGGGSRMGIVSIEGDRLRLCVNGAAGIPTPEKMVSKTGTLSILRVMKRVEDTK